MSQDKRIDLPKGLGFFNNAISSVNMRRQKIRQTKGVANLVLKQTSWNNHLSCWDTPLGVLSFALYYVRLTSNLSLLAYQYTCCSRDKRMSQAELEAISFTLLNDIVWSSINAMQFFWWTFNRSKKAGLLGVQSEGVGMLFDELVMLIQFEKARSQYKKSLISNTSSQEKDILKLNWTYKKINCARSSVHILLFALLFIGFGMGMVTFPISIFIYSTNIISNLLRITLEVQKDKQQLNIMRKHEVHSTKITQHQNNSKHHALQQLNHFFHFLLLVPLALVVSAPGPMALSVGIMMLVFFSDALVEHALKGHCKKQSACIESQSEPAQTPRLT
ncbi:MAG: hypothetical protein P1U32_05260 [Legionellaceae bacterium]|nr:hypothetical protein [Legionellaceae bacterium]